MASPAKKAKTDSSLPVCPYGARCYRKNPQHFKEFNHNSKDDGAVAGSSRSKASDVLTADMSKLPPCKYGASCYRKNLLHFAEFSHPTTVISNITSNDDSDTDEISDSDDEKKDKKDGVKSDDILKRGMSLVKSYSKMSEEERKELIKKAFEAKLKLQKELQETQDEVKNKDKKLQKLQDQVSTGLLLVEGEKEALEGNKTVYFSMKAERSYKEGSADQTHFRLAESQFYRLLSGPGASSYRVTNVEYVVNPVLVKKFKAGREDLKKHRGEDKSYPVLAFHGTDEKNIHPICETGFKVPGDSGFKHKTDTGWYGKGVYFSEFPAYSMGYIQGSTKLLLCQVLPGNVFQCTKLIHGAPLQKGHDSHTSPDKQELVIFNGNHILPSYIVHYEHAVSNFKYKTAGDGVSNSDMLDDQKVASAYAAIANSKASSAFKNEKLMFSGIFQLKQNQMLELAQKHGSGKATPKVFSILVASQMEFLNKSNKVQQAESKGVPVVCEMFVYDCIKDRKLKATEPYEYSD
ncbi:uncharacterized protein LOC132565212 [Ylistrum balloti]|uniref:uncharacterized protein LOC132565212 n=1 Tax=Ylistrum balloti TaxID=509963 RepID=UPI002905E0A2|nr:uncharacterized protein LOC132565212 [Ylistrum balloti]